MKRLVAAVRGFIGSLLFGFCLAACSVLETIDASSASARVLVDIATLAAIEQSDDRAGTARGLIQAAEDARTWLDYESVTLDQLADAARVRIARASLELSGKAALNALVAVLESEVAQRIDAGTLDAEARVTINRMLDWVVQSAQAYAGA